MPGAAASGSQKGPDQTSFICIHSGCGQFGEAQRDEENSLTEMDSRQPKENA